MQGAVIRLPVDPRGVKYMWARFANCSRRGLQKKFQGWLYGNIGECSGESSGKNFRREQGRKEIP